MRFTLKVALLFLLALLGILTLSHSASRFKQHTKVATPLPHNFIFGLATSAFQTDGGNGKTDWDAWPAYQSGHAIHPKITLEDITLAEKIGIHELRFSLEWARIEPEEGKFDTAALQYYTLLATEMQRRNIRPFINLHHFTLPLWLAQKGGLTAVEFPLYFERYTSLVAQHMRPLGIMRWMTFNEPLVPIEMGYLNGFWPPQHKGDTEGAARASWNIICAHKRAYKALHKELDPYRGKKIAVGMAYFDHLYYAADKNSIDDRRVVAFLDQNGHAMMEALLDYMDYIGLNYYNRTIVQFSRAPHPNSEHLVAASNPAPTGELTEERMEIFPEGISLLVDRYAKYNKPILITENGIGDRTDLHRGKFIVAHLRELQKSVDRYKNTASPIIGYFYWTLADNFEWSNMRMSSFGLIAVDQTNLTRSLRPSALLYRDIIKEKGITPNILEKYQATLQ